MKVLLCLLVPLYHTMQTSIQPQQSYSPLTYWVMMVTIFMLELVADILQITQSFTILQLLLFFWCTQGSISVLDPIIDPVFKISEEMFCDALNNKIMDDILDSARNFLKTVADCASKFTFPVSERSIICRMFDYLREMGHPSDKAKVKRVRLISELYKNLTKCKMAWNKYLNSFYLNFLCTIYL